MINPPIHLRLSVHLRDQVLFAAQAEDRPIANMIRKLLTEALEARTRADHSPPARPRDLDEALAEIERETPLTDIPRRPPGTLLKTLKGATKS
jgi:hypothetical protein